MIKLSTPSGIEVRDTYGNLIDCSAEKIQFRNNLIVTPTDCGVIVDACDAGAAIELTSLISVKCIPGCSNSYIESSLLVDSSLCFIKTEEC